MKMTSVHSKDDVSLNGNIASINGQALFNSFTDFDIKVISALLKFMEHFP